MNNTNPGPLGHHVSRALAASDFRRTVRAVCNSCPDVLPETIAEWLAESVALGYPAPARGLEIVSRYGKQSTAASRAA